MKLLIFLFAVITGMHCIAREKNAVFTQSLFKYQQQHQAGAGGQSNMPVKDVSKHVSAIAVLDKTAIVQLAAGLQAQVKPAIDGVLLHELEIAFAKPGGDTSAAATGMMWWIAGNNNAAAIWLLTLGIQKNADSWYVNNLGVILKSKGLYDKAFQCFVYADKNRQPLSAIVKTNMGWTAAYYGDFEAAKKYFTDALKLSNDHDGALEGLATIAYVEGDSKSLMNYLFKRIKCNSGGGNASQQIAPGMIDVIEESYNTADVRKADPFENHLFDNNNENDNQPNPGGGANMLPQMPALTAYFSYDAFGLYEHMDDIRQLKQEILLEQKKAATAISREQAALPAWKKEPYRDEQGDLIIPYNYEPEYKLFQRVTLEFNKRDIWIGKKMIKEEMAFNNTIRMGDQLTKMINACAGQAGSDCMCRWAKPNLAVVNSDYSGYFGFWSRLFKQWLDNVNWYIASTSPFIKRVHHPQLNTWLNHKRQVEVQNYLMTKYSAWLDDCLRIGGEVDILHISKPCVDNPPVISIAAADAINPPLKKLQTWPEKCNVPTGNYDFNKAPAGIIMTCDELKLRFGALHIDTKFGEKESQDVTKIYIGKKLEKSASKDVNISGHTVGELGLGAEVSLDAFITFQNGHVTNYGVEGSADLTGSAAVKSGNDKIDKYLPNGAITASGDFIISAETGMKGTAKPVDMSAGGILQNLK
ncbi:hypothetical protein A3860_08635 [Niastella vici]|uniref:Uncharacterized protein n=1 Tax=Niastella vici TaxID=1703345 RepID=A0A1V9FH39_9BACT|nr:hypothetical protein [Niastella vici]OQP57688.1 hypothetical protein A3860_08635 [Niastella vici]